MIVRIWRGQAAAANADAYQRHVVDRVYPSLREIAGHRGSFLLRRQTGQQIEFLAVTLWESPTTIRDFAGDDIEIAVVEPEARAVLAEFDSFARHYELAYAFGPACSGG